MKRLVSYEWKRATEWVVCSFRISIVHLCLFDCVRARFQIPLFHEPVSRCQRVVGFLCLYWNRYHWPNDELIACVRLYMLNRAYCIGIHSFSRNLCNLYTDTRVHERTLWHSVSVRLAGCICASTGIVHKHIGKMYRYVEMTTSCVSSCQRRERVRKHSFNTFPYLPTFTFILRNPKTDNSSVLFWQFHSVFFSFYIKLIVTNTR